MHLTRRQKEILDFLGRHIERKGYAPTIEEIGEHFGLQLAGHRPQAPDQPPGEGPHQARLEPQPRPRAGADRGQGAGGRAAAARPRGRRARRSRRSPRPRRSSSPRTWSGRKETYVLQVKGDSMIEEQIRDGDYVIVESRQTARDGEMVIALLDGENVDPEEDVPGGRRQGPAAARQRRG